MSNFTRSLKMLLTRHQPREAREAGHLDAMLRLVEVVDSTARTRERPGHFTASAFVADADLERLLLIFHPSLGRWLQPGGHIDPQDVSPVAAALRELAEEAGSFPVAPLPGSPELLDLDVHAIPANPRRGEGPHQHFDLRVGLQALGNVELGGELKARWFALDALGEVDTDDSVRRTAVRIQQLRDMLDATLPYSSPAALRNRDPILDVLRGVVSPGDTLLEVASGSGEHALHLASHLRDVVVQPSDVASTAWASCWWRWREARLANLRPPLMLDVGAGTGWPDTRWDVLLACNIMQVTPWATTRRLLSESAAQAQHGARLVIYSPMSVGGVHISTGNRDFDAQLRGRDARLGVRDRDALILEGSRVGWSVDAVHSMPANNTLVVFRRSDGPAR